MQRFLLLITLSLSIFLGPSTKADRLVLPAPKSCNQAFQELYGLLEKGAHPSFQSISSYPTAHALLTWLWLIKRDPQATLADYSHFMDLYPSWPLMTRIQENGESLLNFQTPRDMVVVFFKERDPVTSQGMVHYVRALFSKNGSQEDKKEGIQKLRHFWINKNLTAAHEQFFYTTFGTYLRQEDHEKRLDRLMMEGNIYGLKRMEAYLSKGHGRAIEAALALIQNQKMADLYVKRLNPKDLEREGILYQRIKWLLSKAKKEEALEMFLGGERNPLPKHWEELWFKHRYYFARFLFKKKEYDKVYKILKIHGLNPSREDLLTDYAAAEWFLGWISLKFLRKPTQALVHFKNMAQRVKTPMSQAKSLYWLGKAEADLGKKESAAAWFEKAAQFPHVFYGQEALKVLKKPLLLSLKDGPDSHEVSKETKEMEEAMLLLRKANPKDRHLKTFLMHLIKTCRPGEQEQVVHWIKVYGFDYSLVLYTKIAGRKGPILLKHVFPRHPFDRTVYQHPHLTPVFLHALVRQESGFDKGIKSPAGASGMMQIMPHMAQKFCKILKIPFHPKKLTTDADYNIRLGVHFLHGLLTKFQGNLPLTLAAYNAGESWVQEWLQDYGDPRLPGVDTLQWIESIPFSETRIYIMRILESLPLYRLRLQEP